jgi:hypothetical protein
MKKIFAFLLVIFLASCADPVGQFSQKQISSNQFEIQLAGNWNIPSDQIWINWIYRCAELTKAKGYVYFGLSDPSAVRVRPSNSAPAPQALLNPSMRPIGLTSDVQPQIRSGVYRADDAVPHTLKVAGKGGGVVVVPVYGGRGATVYSYHDDMVITMYSDPLPLEAEVVLRAQTIIDAYGPYVTSNGKATLADTKKDVIAQAQVVSPLRSSYREYVFNLIAKKRPQVAATITADNFVEIAKSEAPAYPLTEAWRPVGSEASFLNPESIVADQRTLDFVMAREVTNDGSSFQFSRVKTDCSSGSSELISTAFLENSATPSRIFEVALPDTRAQIPGATLKQASVLACQLGDATLKPVLGVVPLDFPWGDKWTALKYMGNKYGVREAFLENHIQLKLDDTIIVRGAWLTDDKSPKVYTVNWFHIDCAARKYGVTHWGMGNFGTTLNLKLLNEGKDDNPKMLDIAPDTPQGDLMDLACERAKTMQAAQN